VEGQSKSRAAIVIIIFLLIVLMPVTVAIFKEMQARKTEVKQVQPPATENTK
jgi:hypothetical protein